MNKDKVTNLCGIAIVVSGALVAADQAHTINLGPAVDAALTVIGVVATAMIGYFTGKPTPPAK